MLAQTAFMVLVLLVLWRVWKVPHSEKIRSASWEERKMASITELDRGSEEENKVEMNELDKSI